MKLSDADRNLNVPGSVGRSDVIWHDAREDIFRIYGTYPRELSVPEDEPFFARLPRSVASGINDGVSLLSANTSGIRLRMRTDSPFICIHAEWNSAVSFPHMPATGIRGFDLYRVKNGRQEFAGIFTPPAGPSDGYESLVRTPGGMQDLILYFPLYNDISRLYIGLQEKSVTEKPAGYRVTRPAVFYGSSITQGGCASRPSNSYQSMLSRGLDIDYINLGFSGSARGEEAAARYVSGLDMSVFICDYDHNAPDAAHLEKTHYRFYELIREKQPDLPYIVISKPDFFSIDPAIVRESRKRRAIIKATYDRARGNGDANIYYLNGASIYSGDKLMAASVDGCHPNDLGFYYFYKALSPLIRKILFPCG